MFMRITLHFEIFFPAFCTILPCVLHQNALQLAPKRTAFSGILHCILLQMAQNLARTVTALNKNSFWRIHIYPPFASKPTSARIDFLRQVGRLVHRKGTHNVKTCTEKLTKTDKAMNKRVDKLTSWRVDNVSSLQVNPLTSTLVRELMNWRVGGYELGNL